MQANPAAGAGRSKEHAERISRRIVFALQPPMRVGWSARRLRDSQLDIAQPRGRRSGWCEASNKGSDRTGHPDQGKERSRVGI